MSILTSWMLGDWMAGGRNTGALEGEHAASMATSEANHRVIMAEMMAEQKVQEVFSYASNQRMKLACFRKATDDLIGELQKANINHPLVDKDVLLNMAKAELEKEFAKPDEQRNEETIKAIVEYHQPNEETKS